MFNPIVVTPKEDIEMQFHILCPFVFMCVWRSCTVDASYLYCHTDKERMFHKGLHNSHLRACERVIAVSTDKRSPLLVRFSFLFGIHTLLKRWHWKFQFPSKIRIPCSILISCLSLHKLRVEGSPGESPAR